MEIQKIDGDFSVCKVRDFSKVQFDSPFCFIGKTDAENSLVCRTEIVPDNTVAREDGWKACRKQGVLDFTLVGILSDISALLAKHKIGIFAISTYNTDYIFTKAADFENAMQALAAAGYTIV